MAFADPFYLFDFINTSEPTAQRADDITRKHWLALAQRESYYSEISWKFWHIRWTKPSATKK